jgi:hypothetical protein
MHHSGNSGTQIGLAHRIAGHRHSPETANAPCRASSKNIFNGTGGPN